MSSKDIGDQICFNCKVGHCQGGVCHDINELKADEIKKVVRSNQIKGTSILLPTIRRVIQMLTIKLINLSNNF